MNSRNRLQVIVLSLLGFLVIIRLFSGPPSPHGAIIFSKLDARELRQQIFQVSEGVTVVIDATGSIDERRSGEMGLAAYPWITHDGTGSVIWEMDGSNTILEGSLAHVKGDELVLEAGTYTLNFVSYGQLLSRSRAPFWKDNRKWHVMIQSPENEDALRPISGVLKTDLGDQVWAATALGRNEKREYFFEVLRPAELDIHAIGQLSNDDGIRPVDYSSIEDAVTGQVVWYFSRDNTTWAGGAQENRMFEGNVAVQPGIYRTVAVTDSRHNYGSWEANPPYNPDGWGVHLSSSTRDRITTFDPWMQDEPVIAFIQVGDDARLEKTFIVHRTTPVVLYAMGEITGPNNGYDLAWLDQLEGDGGAHTLWEMTYENSVPAGGAQKNRKTVKFLNLEPGSYVLHYKSDESHSYENWNAHEPERPERWGVALFRLRGDGPEFTIIDSSAEVPAPVQ